MRITPDLNSCLPSIAPILGTVALLCALCACSPSSSPAAEVDPRYEHEKTRDLVRLVNDAAELVEKEGEKAFRKLRVPKSRWQHDESYVFVFDPDGKMLVHGGPAMEGQNLMELKDVDGRPILRGLLEAATADPDRAQGWYHYKWPVPGAILPRWKSSYVRLVKAPSGKRFIVGSGMYNDRMEKAFVVDMVKDATLRIEEFGKDAFPLLRDQTGPFYVKDAYVFVIDPSGVELVNPAFPNLEGRNILDVKDTEGKAMVREMLQVVNEKGSGWVHYVWPKPGESVSTRKSTYVSKARLGNQWVLVGSGVYLANAPKAEPPTESITAPELMAHVREGAALLEKSGEEAFPQFRKKGTKWFRDDLYFFVWTLDGKRVFHAANPSIEGRNARDEKDIRGRPYGEMFLAVANSPSGEGWVHYLYPEPGKLFPIWKSTYLKRVTFPPGKQHIIGSGIYNMKMDETFITDLVDRAVALVRDEGENAFTELRDKNGPYYFMDTYVFVDDASGIELVNPAYPSLEGVNIMNLRDGRGKALGRDYITAALKQGSAWVEYYWYKPGENTQSRKKTYVRSVESGDKTYIVGSGLYIDDY